VGDFNVGTAGTGAGEGEGTVDAVGGTSAAGVYSCIKIPSVHRIHLCGDELDILSVTPNSMPNSMLPDSSVHLPPESPLATYISLSISCLATEQLLYFNVVRAPCTDGGIIPL